MSEPEPGTYKTIHQLMGSILAQMPAIGKTQKNVQQNFMFRGHDDVLNALNPLLAKHGVYVIPDAVERVTAHRETAKGSTMYEVNLHVRFRFYGPGGDYVEASGWGEGTDMGDKATSKAMTMAFKYVLAQVFAVSTAAAADPDGQTAEETYRPENTRSQDGPGPFPVPRSWAKVQEAVRGDCDNPDEAWRLFQAFTRAASYHLYGQTDSKELTAEQRKVLLQKAAGATAALHDATAKVDGPFVYFDHDAQRAAWASVLDGTLLETPDYVAPVDVEQASLDEEAARQAEDAP